jgi:hypothetical protein
MGHVIKRLTQEAIPDKPTLMASRMTVEKCENIHLHYRNFRFEFSEEEFQFFASTIAQAKERLDDHPEETEFLSLVETLGLQTSPAFWPNRITTEANLGAVHLHYKNFRLELTKDEYVQFSENIAKSRKMLNEVKGFVAMVPLEYINPFDGGHYINPHDKTKFICHDQEQHEEQIEKIKEAIQNKEKIRPIAALWEQDLPLQRMDGFCRYWAHKDLDIPGIEVILCPLAYAGCQDKKPFVISDEEYESIKRGETY